MIVVLADCSLVFEIAHPASPSLQGLITSLKVLTDYNDYSDQSDTLALKCEVPKACIFHSILTIIFNVNALKASSCSTRYCDEQFSSMNHQGPVLTGSGWCLIVLIGLSITNQGSALNPLILVK